MQQGKEPEYLDYNIKGRGFLDRMPYNAGAFYITGEKKGGMEITGTCTEGVLHSIHEPLFSIAFVFSDG